MADVQLLRLLQACSSLHCKALQTAESLQGLSFPLSSRQQATIGIQAFSKSFSESLSGHDRGIEKHGGSIRLASHVKEIVVGDGKASGVRLRSGEVLHASKAVISNASLNDTVKMLHPDLPVTQQLSKQAEVRLLGQPSLLV